MDDQRKDQTDMKELAKRNDPPPIKKKLQTHNMPADDGENTNDANSLISRILFSDEQKTTLRGNERNRRATIHWSTHPQGEQNNRKICNNGMDWLQKGRWYGLSKLDYRLSQNALDIRRSRKVFREYHGKFESWIDYRKKKIIWGKNLARVLPGRCSITISIFNSNAATE